MKAVIEIYPHEDGVRCGRCDKDQDCVLLPGSVIARSKRIRECLAATQEYRDLTRNARIAALREVREMVSQSRQSCDPAVVEDGEARAKECLHIMGKIDAMIAKEEQQRNG